MKISLLIKLLHQIEIKYGDLPVYWETELTNLMEVDPKVSGKNNEKIVIVNT